jgi:hypothetical protein
MVAPGGLRLRLPPTRPSLVGMPPYEWAMMACEPLECNDRPSSLPSAVGPPRSPGAALRFVSGPRCGLPFLRRAFSRPPSGRPLRVRASCLPSRRLPASGGVWAGQSQRLPPAGPSSERDPAPAPRVRGSFWPVGVLGGGVGGVALSSVVHPRRIRNLTDRSSGDGSRGCVRHASPLARPVRTLMRAPPARPRKGPHPQAEVLRKSSWPGSGIGLARILLPSSWNPPHKHAPYVGGFI